MKTARTNQLIILLFCALALFNCQHTETQLSKHQLYVFGTLVELNIWSDKAQNTAQAVAEISTVFNAMHHQWHAWKPGRLSTINQALRASETILLTEEEQAFIQRTIDLAKQSQHHFNPAMGELIHLWGFHTDEYPLLTPPPSTAQINTLIQQNTTVDDLTINNAKLSSSNPVIWLDFGGIAKGYAVDKAVSILHKHQITDAIINAGGDLRSIGSKGHSPWRVAIQSPKDWSMLAEVEVVGDESIFTSGNYQRYKEFNGQRYAHIIDSKTGMPVTNVISATVIAADGITADATATAMVVAGDGWPEVAAWMGVDQVLIINEQQQCSATAAMIDRLEKSKVECEIISPIPPN